MQEAFISLLVAKVDNNTHTHTHTRKSPRLTTVLIRVAHISTMLPFSIPYKLY